MKAAVLVNRVGKNGIEETVNVLRKGGSLADALESGIRIVESDPGVHSVGWGSWPNMDGILELDASMMDGNTRKCGAVGALQGFLHPITVARGVMEKLPHVFLAGEGAVKFAREIGAEEGDNLSSESLERYNSWRDRNASLSPIERAWKNVDPETLKGTTVFLVRHPEKGIASGVSTSGWAWKYPGRLGDSPVIGAGSYADSRYGGAGCTGLGELTIRTNASRLLVYYLKEGYPVREAVLRTAVEVAECMDDVKGTVVIHALDMKGSHSVCTVGAESQVPYWYWEEGMEKPEERESMLV
ncbi:MAG: isoaspartyl peptidase/L-asparaginase [Spirochaetia bacterium]